MILDNKDIKVYIISPGAGKYRERVQIVFQRLLDVGYSNIEFVRSIPAESGTNSLTLTNITIFEKELKGDKPFLVIEDDCQVYHMHSKLHIPDDADVVYLGVSDWVYPHSYETLGKGYHIRPNGPGDSTDCTETMTRIRGFTGGHAILFLNREYIRQFCTRMRPLLPQTIAHDLVFATMHSSFNVYALKKPMYYQDASLGGQETVTKLCYNGERYI